MCTARLELANLCLSFVAIARLPVLTKSLESLKTASTLLLVAYIAYVILLGLKLLPLPNTQMLNLNQSES